MLPVAVLKIRSEGKLGEIANVKTPTPPDAVIGVNAVVTVPCVRILEATATVVTIGGLMTLS
jgi:hypothetical protein